MGAYLSLAVNRRKVGWSGRLLTFSALRMGSYSRWALIRDWALIRISMCNQMVTSEIRY